MFHFQIQADSDIPPSKQLFDQIQFAIASRQCIPGERLPSTRHMATITGLHRNTISKVYRQLEAAGLVNSEAGSGIYVKGQGHQGNQQFNSPLFDQYPQAKQIIEESIENLLAQGCTLTQVKELLIGEIDWRLRCMAKVVLTVPSRDMEAGSMMVKELQQSLLIPVELVPLEELPELLSQNKFGTVVTSRYFIREVVAFTEPQSVRVIPLDIYDYAKELEMIKNLPKDSRLGLVSLSAGTLGVAEIIVHSLRGNDLLIMIAQVNDKEKLKAIIRNAHVIIADPASYILVKKAIAQAQDNLIRLPEVICTENYIGEKSINFLKRELGLGVS